ncbi:MAG: hypothetical protein IPQ00_03860 [Chloracidobacterium sp.]|nr:hypothetical protein [Chloracidobacterium sp.]
MKRSVFSLFLIAVTAVFTVGQGTTIVRKELAPAEIARIIKKVSENESAFREALKDYVFTRRASMSNIGLGGQVTGTYRRDSFMTFNADGGRFEKILFAPISTLTEMTVTPEDLEDLGGVNPFALEPYAIPQYNFNFQGVERIDDYDLYVFDVAPKVIPDPKKSKQRLFVGRIWVDIQDLMILKSKGKAVPETKQNKFPIVETTREQIDGKYWFPVDARSDDDLVFDSGQVVKLRMRVKYSDYKVGRTDVRILDDVADPETKPILSPILKKPG